MRRNFARPSPYISLRYSLPRIFTTIRPPRCKGGSVEARTGRLSPQRDFPPNRPAEINWAGFQVQRRDYRRRCLLSVCWGPWRRRGQTGPCSTCRGVLVKFPICSLVKGIRAFNLTSTLLCDCILPLGKPRRIIADNGPPGAIGVGRGELSRAYCIKLVRAPQGNSPSE